MTEHDESDPSLDGPTRADLEAMFPPEEDDLADDHQHENERSSSVTTKPYPLIPSIVFHSAFLHCLVLALGLTGNFLVIASFDSDMTKFVICVTTIVNGVACAFGIPGFLMLIRRNRNGIRFAWRFIFWAILGLIISTIGWIISWHDYTMVLGQYVVVEEESVFALGRLLVIGLLFASLMLTITALAVRQFDEWSQPRDLALEGETNCSNCGRVLSVTARVCPRCMTKRETPLGH